MLGLGLFSIVTGIASILLGVVLAKGEAKGTKKKKKKSDSGAQAPPPNPKGFYLGGAVFIVAGVVFLALALNK